MSGLGLLRVSNLYSRVRVSLGLGLEMIRRIQHLDFGHSINLTLVRTTKISITYLHVK